jgi:drug/metabolite transporter (DMT)-like permease
MEKQLSMIGYWLGVISLVLALIFRAFTAMNMIPPHMGAPDGSALSYMSFLHGAALFFLLAIASWRRTAKS